MNIPAFYLPKCCDVYTLWSTARLNCIWVDYELQSCILYPLPIYSVNIFSSPRMASWGMAEKLLLMRSRFRFVFPPFHFQNGGRRIKNEHLIVLAFGNILLAQGSYKQLGYFGQWSVLMFWLWSRGSKRCWQFSQVIKTALPKGNFQLFQIHPRYCFSFS